jgi:DNA-binding protein HU-beta
MHEQGRIIESVANAADLSRAEATRAVDAVLDSVTKTARVTVGRCLLVGFGTFSVKKRAARTGRNPEDGRNHPDCKASNVPGFKAGKALKDAVN